MFASMSSILRNVRINGREIQVRVEQNGSDWRIEAGNGARNASVVEVEPGVYSILLDGRSYEVRASELDIDGRGSAGTPKIELDWRAWRDDKLSVLRCQAR